MLIRGSAGDFAFVFAPLVALGPFFTPVFHFEN